MQSKSSNSSHVYTLFYYVSCYKVTNNITYLITIFTITTDNNNTKKGR